jgi:excisionase family DNA binding protein
MPAIGSQPKLISTKEAAALLNVTQRTITNWIEAGKVPYLRLPGGDYRLPISGLLASLSGTYDLSAELKELDSRFADVDEGDVLAKLDETNE